MKEFDLTEYLKNPSQRVVTRDGREVRIICTDHKGSQPIIALVTINGKEDIRTFYPNGRWSNTNEWNFDLFFAPIKREGWVNLYKSHRCSTRERIAGDVFPSEKEAKESQIYGYITTIKIEWEE